MKNHKTQTFRLDSLFFIFQIMPLVTQISHEKQITEQEVLKALTEFMAELDEDASKTIEGNGTPSVTTPTPTVYTRLFIIIRE